MEGPISRESRWVPCGAGDQAEQDLRLAELCVVRGDPEVGAERQFAAAAQRIAGDGGDNGLGDTGDGREGVLQAPGPYDHRRMVHGLHLLDVRAGREHLLAAVQNHGPYVLAAGRLLGELAQPVLDGDVQCVHRRTVETDGADAFGDLERNSHAQQVSAG